MRGAKVVFCRERNKYLKTKNTIFGGLILLGRQLPDDNRNMMISRSSGRSGFIYMVNV